MTLDEAFTYIEHTYTESQERDIRDGKMIEALGVIQSAHPKARPLLIHYWRAIAYQPDLDIRYRNAEVQACHPIMRQIFRRCGREGY